MEELKGGLILADVDEWMRTFLPELEGDPGRLSEKVALGAASDAERERKYSYAKLHEMFLLYIKCSDGGEDTVVRALCQNYFTRAYRSYKIPIFAHKTFDSSQTTLRSFAHNDEIIASFGETTTRLCKVGLVDERVGDLEKLPEILRQRDMEIEQLKEEISLERAAKNKVREEMELSKDFEINEFKKNLTRDHEQAILERELAVAERLEALSSENASLRRRADQGQVLQEQLQGRNAAQSNTIEELTAESRRFRSEYERVQAVNTALDARTQDEIRRLQEDIRRLQEEHVSIARSATERVSALTTEVAVLTERVENEQRNDEGCKRELAVAKRDLEKGREQYAKLVTYLPTAYLDKDTNASANCVIS